MRPPLADLRLTIPAFPMSLRDLTWVLTTGEAGMRSQALGLAEAVGLPIEEKRIVVRRPWAWLPGGLLPMPLSALDPSGDLLAPPWPRLVVGCGRRSIGIALAVKRAVAGAAHSPFTSRTRNGDGASSIWSPHCRTTSSTGPNVVKVPTALHGVTQRASRGSARRMARAPRPRACAASRRARRRRQQRLSPHLQSISRQLIRIL